MDKRFIGLATLALVAMLAFFGCSTASKAGGADATSKSSSTSVETTGNPQVTFPKVYFQDTKSSEEAVALLDDLGATDIVENADGSYTATLSQDKFSALVKNEFNKAMEAIDGLKNSSRFPNIASVTYDDNLTAITIQLKTDQPGLADSYAPAEVGNAAITYQTIAGLTAHCKVTVVGASGKTISETVYPL